MDKFNYYHQDKPREAVESALRVHGRALAIDCHSFPAEPRPYYLDYSLLGPDICIGTYEYNTPQDLIETVVVEFQLRGFKVTFNRPFSGALVPQIY